MKKKLIATLLLLAMAICLLPAAAFADSAEPSNASGARTIMYAFKDYNGKFVSVDGSVLVTYGCTYKNYVCIVQSVLTQLYKVTGNTNFNPQGVDGIFGRNTEAAIQCFQVAYMGANEGDGVVGQRTWAKLQEVWTKVLGSRALPNVQPQ